MKVNNPTSNPVKSGETSGARQAGRTSDAKKSDRQSATEAPSRIKSNENTEISPKSRDFAQAKAVAGQAPDIREDRVAELKKQIEDGNYAVDTSAIADKLVDEHLKMPGMS